GGGGGGAGGGYGAGVGGGAGGGGGWEVTSGKGLAAPAGTPAPILDRLNAVMREILVIPEVKARYAEFGVEAKASSPAELKARFEADIKKWSAVIEKAGIPKQ